MINNFIKNWNKSRYSKILAWITLFPAGEQTIFSIIHKIR